MCSYVCLCVLACARICVLICVLIQNRGDDGRGDAQLADGPAPETCQRQTRAGPSASYLVLHTDFPLLLLRFSLPNFFFFLFFLIVVLIFKQWFMCAYVNVLPLSSVLRVWDALLLLGPIVLFRIALALLKAIEGK